MSSSAKISNFYNSFYDNNEETFGENPVPSVRVLVNHLKKGSHVLDIGAGDGEIVFSLHVRG